MDMRSREQYLESVRQEYRQADRRQKSKLLNEARKRTRLTLRANIDETLTAAVIREQGGKENHRERKQDDSSSRSRFN